MALEVIGAGFGRTGTLSLKLALEQLGFAPCYHMVEVFSHPGHAAVWDKAARSEAVDWDALFAGYRAGVDWPICHFWREMSVQYPQAKFILTERDAESWYASISKTIFETLHREADASDPARREQRKMIDYLIAEKTFPKGLDKDHAIAVYKRHNQEVKDTLPSSRLLVFDAPQGWAPLCEFLNVPVPAAPFPKTNSTEEFRARSKR
jgi:hypothetical protein